MAGMLPGAAGVSLQPLSVSAINVANISPAAPGAAPGSVLPSAVAALTAQAAPLRLALPPITLAGGMPGMAAGAAGAGGLSLPPLGAQGQGAPTGTQALPLAVPTGAAPAAAAATTTAPTGTAATAQALAQLGGELAAIGGLGFPFGVPLYVSPFAYAALAGFVGGPFTKLSPCGL